MTGVDRDARLVTIGIDVGTTETKAGAVSLEGDLVAIARRRHATTADPAACRSEQDPEAWWAGLVETVRHVAANASASGFRVGGLCVAGHGPTLVAVDAVGRAVRPAITWQDARPAIEAEAMRHRTGVGGWGLGVLPAAAWLERHEPDHASQAAWYLNTWEALALRLTGVAAATHVGAEPDLSPEQLAATGVVNGRVPPPIVTGSLLGPLRDDVASALGLPVATPVAAGLVDAHASLHGARMLEPGDAVDVGGAAGGFGLYWDSPLAASGSFTAPAPLPGLWLVGGAFAATGAAVDWLRDRVLAGSLATADLIAEAGTAAAGADGLVFLPYLAGERSPLWDPAARGAFVGLTLRHGRPELARAVLEASAFAIRHLATGIEAAGGRITAMRVCGGPARSLEWDRIKADVTGYPVEVPRVLETAVVGAAIVAATAIGARPDLPSAIRTMTAIEHRIEPDRARRDVYDRGFERYLALSSAIRDGRAEVARA